MRVFVPLALFLSLVGGAAAAQQEMLAPRVPEPAVAAPAFVPTTQAGEAPALRPQRQGDINFISGGASADDRAALQAVAAKYNMRLMFAMQPGGAYLAEWEAPTDFKGVITAMEPPRRVRFGGPEGHGPEGYCRPAEPRCRAATPALPTSR